MLLLKLLMALHHLVGMYIYTMVRRILSSIYLYEELLWPTLMYSARAPKGKCQLLNVKVS